MQAAYPPAVSANINRYI